MPFTKESAAEAGKKSGEVRRRRKKPDEKARNALLEGAKGAAATVAAIASASEGFEEVKPELQFKAALVVLEYVLGKPKGLLEEDKEKADTEGFDPGFSALLNVPEGGADDADEDV